MSPPPGHEPFLRAICQAPDDDAPRLVFADWLEENGDPDRAEFIRLHVRLTREPDAVDLADRCTNLFQVKSRRWIADLPGTTSIWARLVGSRLPIHSRARLVLEGLEAGDTWLECEPSLADWERGFPATAYLQGGCTEAFLAALERVAEFVPVRRLRTLWLDDVNVVILELARRPFMTNLRELILPGVFPSDDAAMALAGSPYATGLRHVSLDASRLTDRAGRAFAESSYLAGLEMLHLVHNEFNGATKALLRARFGFNVYC
jgi:uncharacterized protein (TIGR02996 family)